MDAILEPEPSERTRTGDQFELAVRGTSVLLSIRAEAGAAPPTAGEILSALSDLPVDSVLPGAVFGALRDSPEDPVVVGSISAEPDATWAIRVSQSRLAAWVVPFPIAGETDGPGFPVVAARELSARLTSKLVTFGVLQDVVDSFGEGRELEAPVLLARAVSASPGRNGSVEFLVDANESIAPSQHEDGTVDYRSLAVQRFVEEGAPLVRRHPPVAGVPGRDLAGHEVAAPPVRDEALTKYQGKGTRIEGDELVAAIAGRPVRTNDKIDVLPIYEVKGDVGFGVGNIDFVGDVVVRGDVRPGFAIHAGGSVTVQGIVDHATIEAGGDITARGIAGDEHCALSAGKDIAAHYLHNIHVVAKGAVRVQREILNCQVECERLDIPSAGRFVGGRLTARTGISVGTLGSIQSTATWVEVPARVAGKRCAVRAMGGVHPGTTIDIGHALEQVEEHLPPSSFWEFEGQIVRFEPGSNGPQQDVA